MTDDIARVQEHKDPMDDVLVATMNDWEKELTSFMSQTSTEHYVGGGTWRNAFWRTMLGNLLIYRVHSLRRVIEDDHSSFRAYCDRRSGDKGGDDISESIRSFAVNQTFFITERGYVGLGPHNAKPGDDVCVAFGSNVPFLLRHINEELDSKNFALVGDADVHEIMDSGVVRKMEGEQSVILLH